MRDGLPEWLSGIPLPEGSSFVDVAASGYGHVCGLREDDSVACTADFSWRDALRAGIPNEQGFVGLEAGGPSACALRADGTAACFGALLDLPTPTDAFVQLKVGNEHACGLKADGSILCWGRDPYWSALPMWLTSETYGSIDVANDLLTHRELACATVTSGLNAGRVQCFGPEGTYWVDPGYYAVDVSLGAASNVCIRDDAGRLRCRASNGSWKTGAPYGEVVSDFWTGIEDVCAVPQGGSLVCDGLMSYHVPSDTSFVQLALGSYTACGVYADHSLACFGPNDGGIRDTLAGHTFFRVAVGSGFACGLTEDSGAVECWGAGDHGQTLVPDALR